MRKENDIQNLWEGMPEFIQEKQLPFFKANVFIEGENKPLFVRFDNSQDLKAFVAKDVAFDGDSNFYFKSRAELMKISDQKITSKTKSIWYPFKSHWGGIKHKYTSEVETPNKYPVYIVSKGRATNGITTKALDRMGVPHYIVVEEFEKELYEKHTNGNILILPPNYLREYNTCDDVGEDRSKGPGAARNFCIDHATKNGFKRHWVMDDNLDAFHYLNRNEKLEVESAATLRACEDFVDRFNNVPVAGMNYYSFCKKTDKVPPIVLNTRIYSCLLIENAAGYRWRGRYNEDTDLSLRVLKDGLCTIQFNTFLCGKVTTQRMRGGNSKEFYDNEGTLPKSKMLEDLHPDVSKVVWKFNRWHHHVDYRPYKNNILQIKDDSVVYEGVNNYGMIKVNK